MEQDKGSPEPGGEGVEGAGGPGRSGGREQALEEMEQAQKDAAEDRESEGGYQ